MSAAGSGCAIKVSVLLKSYNYAAYLPAAIESALAQDAPFPFEIVLSDDCSQDECPAIVRDFAQRFPEKIRVLERAERFGMVRNTMETFLACRGEHVAWLDGDDYWTATDKLRRQVELLDRHPEFVGSCTGVKTITAEGDSWIATPTTPQIWRLENLFQRCDISACSVMLRRAAVKFPLGYERLPVGDLPMYLLAARHGAFYHDPAVTAVHRLHGRGNATAHLRAARDSWERVIVEAFEQLRGEFDSHEFRMGLARHYLQFLREVLLGKADRKHLIPYCLKAVRSVPIECGWFIAQAPWRRVRRWLGLNAPSPEHRRNDAKRREPGRR